MALRKMRWLTASVLATVATIAAPSQSFADTQVIVQQYDASNNPVGSQGIFNLSNLPSNTSPFITQSFNITSIGVTPTNSGGSSSLSTNIIINPSSSFTAGDYLKVIVTSDGFTNPNVGGTGTLVNDPSKTQSNLGAINSITGNTQLFTGTIGSLTPFSPPVSLTDTETTGGGDALSSTTVNNVPDAYVIQQTLTIRITPPANGGGTFTDSLSSSMDVSPAPVPAPAGLALAVAAIPVLGLRRLTRRKVTV